jgi:hypothetical protein
MNETLFCVASAYGVYYYWEYILFQVLNYKFVHTFIIINKVLVKRDSLFEYLLLFAKITNRENKIIKIKKIKDTKVSIFLSERNK